MRLRWHGANKPRPETDRTRPITTEIRIDVTILCSIVRPHSPIRARRAQFAVRLPASPGSRSAPVIGLCGAHNRLAITRNG